MLQNFDKHISDIALLCESRCIVVLLWAAMVI